MTLLKGLEKMEILAMKPFIFIFLITVFCEGAFSQQIIVNKDKHPNYYKITVQRPLQFPPSDVPMQGPELFFIDGVPHNQLSSSQKEQAYCILTSISSAKNISVEAVYAGELPEKIHFYESYIGEVNAHPLAPDADGSYAYLGLDWMKAGPENEVIDLTEKFKNCFGSYLKIELVAK